MSHQHHSELPPHYIKNIENTIVMRSSVHGFGLFATRDIKKQDLLCTIRGQIMHANDYEAFLKTGHYPITVFIEKTSLGDGMVMAMPFRTSYSFINHHPEKQHIFEMFCKDTNILKVFAAKDISKGEEIFDRYNLDKHIDVLGGFRSANH